MRDNANSAASYTVRPATAKLRAFALSGFIAGLGGALLAGAVQQIAVGEPDFLVDSSLALVAMVVIGGMGSPAGAVIGALWVIGLPTPRPGQRDRPAAVVQPRPARAAALLPRRPRPRRLQGPRRPVPPARTRAASGGEDRHRRTGVIGRAARAPAPDVPLRTDGITVTFGGVRANDDISIEVGNGQIVGLIGTNGAGKTTLMNAIGGYVPASGRVELLGHDVSHQQPAERARDGLGRTFQAATLFPELTVRETV